MRERADLIRLGELDWVMPKLPTLSQSEREVIEQFSARLVNKLLHAPTLRLRESGNGDHSHSMSELVLHVFDVEEDDTSHGNGVRAEAGRHLCSFCAQDDEIEG